MPDFWGLVGRNPDDDRVFIRISLAKVDGLHEGVDHKLYDCPVTVAMDMMVVSKGQRKAEKSGFLPGEIAVCRPASKYALTGGQIRALGRLAMWHRNDRREFCHHQLVWTQARRNATKAALLEAIPKELSPCPDGYRAGKRWLLEPVSAVQLESLQRICRELNGDRPWQMEAL